MPDKKPETSHSKAGGENIGRFIHIWRNVVEKSAEGANFIFPAIHHLRRHLLWAERHIANLLLIPHEKHFRVVSFSKNKVK